jgi:hypothetical protein
VLRDDGREDYLIKGFNGKIWIGTDCNSKKRHVNLEVPQQVSQVHCPYAVPVTRKDFRQLLPIDAHKTP